MKLEIDIYNTDTAQQLSANWDEADLRVFAAMNLLHTIWLDRAAHKENNRLIYKLKPSVALDLHLFYELVIVTFREWSNEYRPLYATSHSNVSTVNLDKAINFINSVKYEKAKLGLHNFLSILLEKELPQNKLVDALFCCHYLEESIMNEKWLNGILDGSLAESQKRMFLNFENWADSWTP